MTLNLNIKPNCQFPNLDGYINLNSNNFNANLHNFNLNDKKYYNKPISDIYNELSGKKQISGFRSS